MFGEVSIVTTLARTVCANNVAEKYLPALKCLLATRRLQPDHPQSHYQSLRFRRALEEDKTPLDPKMNAVIQENFISQIADPEKSLETLNEEFLFAHWHSPKHVQAGVRLLELLHPELEPAKEKATKHLIQTLGEKGTTIEDAVEGLRVLRELEGSKSGREEYLKKAKERWPEATVLREM